MSQQPPGVEALLARLDAATRELKNVSSSPERSWELLKERGWITRELAELGAGEPFTPDQIEQLGEAVRVGEQVRQALAVRRETAREQARELRGSRRVRNEFQPYRETSGGRVLVDG